MSVDTMTSALPDLRGQGFLGWDLGFGYPVPLHLVGKGPEVEGEKEHLSGVSRYSVVFRGDLDTERLDGTAGRGDDIHSFGPSDGPGYEASGIALPGVSLYSAIRPGCLRYPSNSDRSARAGKAKFESSTLGPRRINARELELSQLRPERDSVEPEQVGRFALIARTLKRLTNQLALNAGECLREIQAALGQRDHRGGIFSHV